MITLPRLTPSKIFLIVFISAILILRLFLAVNRYIDPDEFAHLHWTYLLSQGNLPYQDFFAYHIPFFQLILLPPFFLPPDAAVLIVIRLWMFFLYIGTLLLTYKIAKTITQSTQTALISSALFVIFPMTFDKTIDIRPDILMVLLFLIASFRLWTTQRTSSALAIQIGTAFSLSVLTFPKILFAFPALTYLFFSHEKALRVRHILAVILGGILPVLLFVLYLVANGIFDPAIRAMTQWSVAVNTGKIPFSPWWALSPWPIVYVTKAGPSFPWAVNTTIWIAAAVGLLPLWKKNRRACIFFVLFFVCGFGLLFLFPAPYTQYFLPLSVFACILCAHTIVWLFSFVPSRIQHGLVLLLCATLGTSFLIQFRIRSAPEALNTEQTQVINDILSIADPTETVYDMVGSYVFRPDGYFICCHPYGEFVNKLRPLPLTLRESLLIKKTKFVILDRTGLVFWQAPEPDLTFLLTNYLPSKYRKIYVAGIQFGCQNAACVRADLTGKLVGTAASQELPILFSETYELSTKPAGRVVVIDGVRTQDKQTIKLPAGNHTVRAPADVESFQIKLAR